MKDQELEALEKDCKEIFNIKFIRLGINLDNKPYLAIQGSVTTANTNQLKNKNIEIMGIEATGYQSLVVYVERGV